jgi:multiple antibiotic resistance protein
MNPWGLQATGPTCGGIGRGSLYAMLPSALELGRHSAMLTHLVKFFVVLLLVVEPLGTVPVFAALTENAHPRWRRRMAIEAVGIASLVGLFFASAGAALLHTLGISVDAFKIGGGILLFLLSVEMVYARPSGVHAMTAPEDVEAHRRQDISVFPLAFPMISGPGVLATLLLAFADVPMQSMLFVGQVLAMLLVFLVTLGALLATGSVMRLVGPTGGAVLGRILGVVLAALAVQFVLDGIRSALH